MYVLPFGPEAIPFTKDIFVPDEPYLPFASLQNGYAAFRRSSEVDGQIGEFSTGTLLRTRPGRGVVWWNVNVWAREMLFTEGETPPTEPMVAGAGTQVSALKVRLRWPEYPSREREVLMDIGSGFTISVGPTTQVEVELVVPDASKFTGVLPATLQNVRAATYVVASAWAVLAPIGRPSGRVSQAVYLQDPGQLTQFVKVGDGARFVQIFADAVAGNLALPPSFRVQDNLLQRPLGRISFPALAFNTNRTEIAQNAKFIELTGSPGSDTILNVVQELEL